MPSHRPHSNDSGVLVPAPTMYQAEVQVAHRGGWHLPRGKEVNVPVPHGGSSLFPTGAGYNAV